MYINTLTNEYPISYKEVRKRYKNVSFPDTCVDKYNEYVLVKKTNAPAAAGFVPVEKHPTKENNQYIQSWELVESKLPSFNTKVITSRLKTIVSEEITAFHQSKGYNSLIDVCCYATLPNPKQPEAEFILTKKIELESFLTTFLASINNDNIDDKLETFQNYCQKAINMEATYE